MHEKATGLGLYAILFDAARYEKLRDLTLAALIARNDAVKHLPSNPMKPISDFRRDFWMSLSLTLVAVGLAIAIGVSTGRIENGLPLDWSKVMVLTGTALMAWPTWLMLSGMNSWKGFMLDELLRPYIFRVAFFPGLVLTLAGAV
jgi:hypothetical protein